MPGAAGTRGPSGRAAGGGAEPRLRAQVTRGLARLSRARSAGLRSDLRLQGSTGGGWKGEEKKKKTKEKGLFANHFPYRCSSRLLQTTKQAGAAGSPWRAGQQMKGAAGTHRADVFTRRYSFILLQNDVYIQIKEIDLSLAPLVLRGKRVGCRTKSI